MGPPTGTPRTVVGAWCWLATLGYFPVLLVAAAAWTDPPYRFDRNTISDLGITTCGEVVQLAGPVAVCSPFHLAVNVTFVAVGGLTAAGALLLRPVWTGGRASTAGTVAVVLAGSGGVLVGLAPADRALAAHAVGAALQLPGVIAPLLFAPVVARWYRSLGALSRVCGGAGVLGVLLMAVEIGMLRSGHGPGLGLGATERLALEPLTVWTGAVGVVLVANRRWASS